MQIHFEFFDSFKVLISKFFSSYSKRYFSSNAFCCFSRDTKWMTCWLRIFLRCWQIWIKSQVKEPYLSKGRISGLNQYNYKMVTTENRKFDAIISNVSHKSNYSLVKMQEIVKGQTLMWIFELLIFKWRADIENNIS